MSDNTTESICDGAETSPPDGKILQSSFFLNEFGKFARSC